MECLGPFARRAVTAAIRKTTGGNFIVNTIKLKSLWDQFVIWHFGSVFNLKWGQMSISSTYMMDNGQKHKVVFVTDLTDFRPFVKAIEDQFLKVKDNFHIAISQIFVKKALESEECRTLQKPTATFLKQCAKSGLSHEADKADKPASFEASKEDSSNSSSSSVEKDNEHTTNNQPADEDQIFGLNLLAEEAEAISGQPESDSELDNDKSSDDPSLHLLCKGLAATFHPTEFNDDDAVEARVSEVMNSEVQSHVADTHERTIAFESVKNNNCDNLLNQEQMNQLQNPDMDFIDAAVETCVTLVKIGLLPVRQAFSFCWSSVHMKASNVNMLLKEATEAVEEVVEEMMVEVVVMEVGLMLVGTMVLKVEMLLQTILLLTLMLMMADPMMKTMSQMVLQNQM
ncbi:unnamed protein product [Durusdinium trenchii]|uniref:Uncharacterized protein n=1 Tax=Durusdinium trenchii TaxID=1381693 RepID=A0ABP0RUL5_9DINO